jgi:hypothetical protein
MSTFNLWKNFSDFLKTKKVGETFTKEEIIVKLAKNSSNANTLERYKTYLTKEGYISVLENGLYRKEKPISDISKNAFSKRSEKIRFMPKVDPR